MSELLTTCNSIEDIRREVDNRRKVVFFWDDVFFNYFDDKEAWTELKKDVEKQVIPIRNKVMHHRLIRRFELQQLRECRDKTNRILSLARIELPDVGVEAAQHIIDILKNLKTPLIDPSIFNIGLDPNIFIPRIDPSIFKIGLDPDMFKFDEIVDNEIDEPDANNNSQDNDKDDDEN